MEHTANDSMSERRALLAARLRWLEDVQLEHRRALKRVPWLLLGVPLSLVAAPFWGANGVLLAMSVAISLVGVSAYLVWIRLAQNRSEIEMATESLRALESEPALPGGVDGVPGAPGAETDRFQSQRRRRAAYL